MSSSVGPIGNAIPPRPAQAARLLLLALVLAEIVSAAESTMIFGAMRALLRDFGDPVAVGWSITAFLLVAAGSAAVGARLGDQYGRRRVLLVCLVLAGAGSV